MKNRVQNLIWPLRIPSDNFNPTNTPTSFQKYINKIFAEKLDIFIIVYLDNILIYIENGRNGHITAT